MFSKLIIPLALSFCAWGSSTATFAAPAPPLDLQALFDEAKKQNSSTVRLPAGRYTVTTPAVTVTDFQNLTVEAAGTTLLFSDPTKYAFYFGKCRGLTVRGLTVDFDPLPFTQGTVTAIAADGSSLDFRLHDGYPRLTPAFNKRMHVFDPATRNWKSGAPDLYGNVTILDDSHGQFKFSNRPANFTSLAVGDLVALDIRSAGTFNMTDCADVHLEDVTVLAGPGLAFCGRRLEGKNIFLRCTVKRGPKPGGATEDRLMSTSADAFNFADTRNGPTLEKCDFSFMGDDSVNFHGIAWPVLKVEGNTLWTARPTGPAAFSKLNRPGDTIRIMSPDTFAIRGESKITAWQDKAEPLEVTPEQWKEIWPAIGPRERYSFYKVTLQEPVAAQPGDFFDVPAANVSDFVIRDCYFHDHRARGLRLQATNGIIENNRFERLKGAAISLGPELPYWREAGWPARIIIRNNTIKDVGQSGDMWQAGTFTPGAISLFARQEKPGQGAYASEMRDIQILNNTIDGCTVAGIHINAARDVTISGNRITNVNLKATPRTGATYNLNSLHPIVIQNSVGVKTENNTIPAIN